MNKKNLLSTLLIPLLCAAGSLALVAQAPAKEVLIKRKVLILDFVNKNKADQVNGYLVETIPDAMIDPLSATKSFEILTRDAGKKMVMLKQVKHEDLANEDTAIAVAKELGVDVVVIGSFLVNNNEMLFQARAVEVASGRLAVSRSERGKVGSNMFGLIDKLAKDVAKEMRDELPPIPQGKEYITVGKAVTISVLDLEANGVPDALGKTGGDNLREALLATKLYKLIEARQIRQALQKAGHTPASVDDVKAAELGAKLESNKVVVGRVSKVGDKFEMTARIVDVQTREVMVSATQKFSGEQEMRDASEKIAAKFKKELESEREDEESKKRPISNRFGLDVTLGGALPVADLSPALSLGASFLLSPRVALWSKGKFTLPLRFTTGGMVHFGRSSYGNSLTFFSAPMLLGTGLEWSPFFSPKLTAEFFISGGAAVSYLKSTSLNNTYISTDPAVSALVGVQYRLNPRFYLRANVTYLWVLYTGVDLMSTGINLGAGVNF